MKVDVFDLQGKPVEKINLPKVFSQPIREDLILRAVLSSQSNRRQPYAPNLMAGKRSSAHYHGTRPGRAGASRYSMMGREMARLPRIHGQTVPGMSYRVRFVPQAIKGRKAHPPRVEKIWSQKINKKERQIAIMSAIAATAKKELVLKRGHKVESIKELPIVVDDKIQEIKKTKDLVELLKKIGLTEELDRMSERKIRPGKGKNRGRKYKVKAGPLFVIVKDNGIVNAVRNLSGGNVCRVENLSAEYLAPGAHAGRLAIFTKSAMEKLSG
jgi:large subunit ribosomal protein L4e